MKSLLLLACFATASLGASLEARRPNILFILTDDQGYGDLSVHGNPVLKTPNIDRLHGESLRFTNWHNSPTCSPTRSALQTGRHEFRNGITHTIFEREKLSLKGTTIAQLLKDSGYHTGIFGKWHLGDEDAYQPQARGFEEVFIHGAGGIGQTYPGSCGDAPDNNYFDPAILHNGTFEKTQGYCTDVFFAQATKWISEQKAGSPFYAMITTNAPHGPYIARPEDRALYAGKGLAEDAQSFFGMLHNIDQNVGKLVSHLDTLGIAKDTLVIYMNDNGGTAGVPTWNAGMHGAKGTPWIGGVRGISFWRWPGTLTPSDCGALTAHLDFFRTSAALAGIKLSDALLDQSAEGRSLLPLLNDPKADWEDRHLFTHVGRWPKGSDPAKAKFMACTVRNTRYTLVNEARTAAAQPTWQLFDVIADPAQSKNIATEQPQIVSDLAKVYDQWWASLAGQYDQHEQDIGPKLNPFAERYWKQFGGGPTEADFARMDPKRAFLAPAAQGKAKGKKAKQN
jgi:arylsulfatase A-like enzyme